MIYLVRRAPSIQTLQNFELSVTMSGIVHLFVFDKIDGYVIVPNRN